MDTTERTDLFQILVVASPEPYPPPPPFFCLNFEKQIGDFIRTFFGLLTWDPMGAKISKRYSSYKLQYKVFKTSPEFSSQWTSQKYIWAFEILKTEILTILFSFSLTSDPMRVKISKRCSSYKSQPNVLKQICPEFSFQLSSLNCVGDFLKVEFLLFSPFIIISTGIFFSAFFFFFFFLKISNSPLYPMEKLRTLIIWKTSKRRMNESEIWNSQGHSDFERIWSCVSDTTC